MVDTALLAVHSKSIPRAGDCYPPTVMRRVQTHEGDCGDWVAGRRHRPREHCSFDQVDRQEAIVPDSSTMERSQAGSKARSRMGFVSTNDTPRVRGRQAGDQPPLPVRTRPCHSRPCFRSKGRAMEACGFLLLHEAIGFFNWRLEGRWSQPMTTEERAIKRENATGIKS